MTPEAVRRVLRSWLAIEVLTPQVTKDGWSGLAAEKQRQQRNKGTAAADDLEQWKEPSDDDATPWPLLAERPKEVAQVSPLPGQAAPDYCGRASRGAVAAAPVSHCTEPVLDRGEAAWVVRG